MTNTRKRKPKRGPSAWTRLAPLVLALASSAFAWYAALFLSGSVLVASGVALEFGRGFGLVAFGVFCIAGSEVIRRGMARA